MLPGRVEVLVLSGSLGALGRPCLALHMAAVTRLHVGLSLPRCAAGRAVAPVQLISSGRLIGTGLALVREWSEGVADLLSACTQDDNTQRPCSAEVFDQLRAILFQAPLRAWRCLTSRACCAVLGLVLFPC